MASVYYLKKLKEDFSKRQRLNAAYSLRAYARDLEMPASTLSQVLLGKRPLPLKTLDCVIKKIRLNGVERTLFVESSGRKHLTLDGIQVSRDEDRFILDETYFQIIAEWEHYAALMLFDCKGFDGSSNSIQSRLGITKTRTEVIIANLLQYGLISVSEDGLFVRAHSKFRTTEDVASQALIASHREGLAVAQKKIEDVALEFQDFSSLTVAIDPQKIIEAKIIIREFRQKMIELLKTGNRSEVFQLAIQLYPLTQMESLPKAKKRKRKYRS